MEAKESDGHDQGPVSVVLSVCWEQMIVFYGTSRPLPADQRPEGSVRFGSEVSGEQIQLVDKWIRQPALNLTDLSHLSLTLLCHLYQEFVANHSNSTWEWNLDEVTIKDVLEALHLDGYFSPDNVVDLPLWFRIVMTTLLLICMLYTCFQSCRTVFAVAVSKCSPISVLIATWAVNDVLIVGCTATVEIASTLHDLDVWLPDGSSWFADHFLANAFQHKSAQNYGPVACYVVPFLQNVTALVSATVLSLVICDRYIFVFGVDAPADGKRSRIAGWTVAVAYVLSIGLAMPTFWLWAVYRFVIVDDVPDPDYGIDFCSVFSLCLSDSNLATDRRSFFYIYQIGLCAAIYGPLLLLFLVTFYRRIGRYLRLDHVVQGTECRPIKRKRIVSRSLLALVLIFFASKLPGSLFHVLGLSKAIESTPAAVWIARCLSLLSVLGTCLNPVFYVRLDRQTCHSVASCLRSNSVDVRQPEPAAKSRGSQRGNRGATFDP